MRISDWSSAVCSSDLVIPTEPVRSSERSKLLSAETLAVNRALNGRRAPVGANVAALTTPSVNFARLKLSQPLSLNPAPGRSEEHTSELQSLMRISYAVFCLKKKKLKTNTQTTKKNIKYRRLKTNK